MASYLPLRLLSHTDGRFEVIDTRDPTRLVKHFDIITYTWGAKTDPYDCGIDGVNWNVIITPRKLDDIKRLMTKADIQYLWVDCVCLNQEDEKEIAVEVVRMYEYYKSARKCYILMELDVVWDPREIVDNLKFMDHVVHHMSGTALASETNLSPNMIGRLSMWEDTNWNFPLDRSVVMSTAINLGVLNCYSTCIGQVESLFRNPYFSRVWTFQEMLLGKNITMYGISEKNVSCLGELDTWMDLATDSKDKAFKLQRWITSSRFLSTASIDSIRRVIADDILDLDYLQTQVKGISSARTDIINGGPYWWHDNHMGVSNIFSAISIRPRECEKRRDIFRGLLGVFHGLFTPDETERELKGDDIDAISFAFFKQLSNKTGRAWTKLAISSRQRGKSDWIPVISNSNKLLTTDIFAAVVNLGRLKPKGLAKAVAMTGMTGTPRKYMKISLKDEDRGFQFTFRGCNCGKKVKSGIFSSELIDTREQVLHVTGDETGRTLVQCATILGSLIDPGHDFIEYRRRLLSKLQPCWNISDPNAKPVDWIDRCVSGTSWERPDSDLFRVHNVSMNCRMGEMTDCGSRLQNETTAGISCEVRVDCGCTITAPFSLIFEAITAVEGSSLGGMTATIKDGRILLKDGLGLVQVGDVGRAFSLVAMGGDVGSHKSRSSHCRSTKLHKPVISKLPWPRGRALVREEFTHNITDSMRDYGYVETNGSGNLLICRNVPLGQYKIIGVCIDEYIENKGGERAVTIR